MPALLSNPILLLRDDRLGSRNISTLAAVCCSAPYHPVSSRWTMPFATFATDKSRAAGGGISRTAVAVGTGLGVLRRIALAATLALLPVSPAAGFAFLPQIVMSSTVPPLGDLNPYGVAIVPFGFPSGGSINFGDILISNFNNSNNLQGTGSTIVKLTAGGAIAPNGSATVFFQGSTPAPFGLTTALGVLEKGFVIVGNVPTTDGTLGTIQSGSLFVLDRFGTLVNVIPASPANTLNGPWDLTIFDQGDTALLFVSNVLSGTVSRLELSVGADSVTVSGATQIASGYTVAPNAAALIVGPTGLAFNPFRNILYVASTGDNAIFAIDNAATATHSVTQGSLIMQGGELRGPLALAFAPNGHLLAANGDAVNADPTHPSEIVEFTPNGQFVTQFNVDSGQGGAFGLAVGLTPVGFDTLVVVDDVTNSMEIYLLTP